MFEFLLLGLATGKILPYVMMGVAVFLLLYSSTRRLAGKVSFENLERKKKITDLAKHYQIRDDLEKLIISLQDLSRQINGHIDTRFCKLDVLLQEADAKIKRLEELTGGKSASASAEAEDEIEEVDPETATIYKLADSGKSPVEIAQGLNKNTGEIELILSLRRSIKQSQGQSQIDILSD